MAWSSLGPNECVICESLQREREEEDSIGEDEEEDGGAAEVRRR